MKKNRTRIAVSLLIAMAVSCNEPETVVTNIVHSDGSVTRRIEMKSAENNFSESKIQVPFDSTWTVRDSLEISGNDDTTWVRRGEKHFASTAEINNSYRCDSGMNRETLRHVSFSRKFKWFTTEYRFSEIIGKTLDHGYPVKDFLNHDELSWYYSPPGLRLKFLSEADSLRCKAVADSVEMKTDIWLTRVIISEWIGAFSDLLPDSQTPEALRPANLRSREDEFFRILMNNSENFDSLWTNRQILSDMIGPENASGLFSEADSAVNMVLDRVLVTFSDYTVRIVMPGKVTGTNGFPDMTGGSQWYVIADYFLTEPFEMNAVSRTQNWWAWMVSGFFVLFVTFGLIVRKIRKGRY